MNNNNYSLTKLQEDLMYEINTLKEIVTRQEDRITKLENRIKYLEKVTLNWDE